MTKTIFVRYICFAALLCPVMSISSCRRLIEIPPNPPTSITQEQQFADSSTTMTAVAALYSYPSNGPTGFTFNDGLLSPYTGISSDEMGTSQTDPDYTAFYTASLTARNYTCNTLWSDPYIALYPVNASLEGITGSPGLSNALRQQLTGEVKVLRALYHFVLVNLFGPIPVITSSDYKINSKLGRSSVDSVYSQIIRDLTEAKAALSVTYPSAGRARPNKYTAQAFLSKVYLYRQQWQAAYDEASAVINANVYYLEPDLDKVFLEGSTEAIWQLPASDGNNMTREANAYITADETIPGFFISPQLQAAFEAGDQRFTDWIGSVVVTGTGTPQTYYFPYKYKQLRPASPIEDYMVFRLADIYLVRAEAAAHLGHTQDAIDDMDQVRHRAGLAGSTASPASQEDVIAAILHERQTELFTEWGNRWFDLKRTGTADAVLAPLKPGWQPTDALFPIPQTQLDVNGALKQNPGYQ